MSLPRLGHASLCMALSAGLGPAVAWDSASMSLTSKWVQEFSLLRLPLRVQHDDGYKLLK